jgi:hypothetical protein
VAAELVHTSRVLPSCVSLFWLPSKMDTASAAAQHGRRTVVHHMFTMWSGGAPLLTPVCACPVLLPQVKKQQLPVQEAGEKLGAEYHVPGHIFLCQENPKGLALRR